MLLDHCSDELWNFLWENCSEQRAFVEALGDAAVRGDLSTLPPSPDLTQVNKEHLALRVTFYETINFMFFINRLSSKN